MKLSTSLIQTEHTQRRAYIYIRQSSIAQVYDHQESTRRQYELRTRARHLGWSESSIVIIDQDLGYSASDEHETRAGFQQLFSDVAVGQVGAIFSLEVSRVARQDSEWHRLIEIAAISGTLLIDEQQVYDPRLSDDRLMLGIKGLLSSSELRQMGMRLWENRLRKAQRGELRINLPIGFIFDADEGVMRDPNIQVQDAVKLLFERYQLDGTISGVVRYFHEQELDFPKHKGGWETTLQWGPLSCQRVSAILHNPVYAGAYVFGRKTKRAELKPPTKRHQKTVDLPPEEWAVTLWDAFDGYLTQAEYDENQRQLLKRHGRHQPKRNHRRDGSALLTGLALCGRCGRHLQVRYSGQNARYVTYLCNHRQRRYAEPVCQQIPGADVDRLIAKTVLAALTPVQIELAVAVADELSAQQETLRQQWQHRLDAANYAVRLAERRYEQVDPDNRLVASTLEQRWNDALLAVTQIEADFAQQMQLNSPTLDSNGLQHLHDMVHDLPQLWQADTTSWTQRKALLAFLIADVTLTRNQTNVLVHIRWHTNQLSTLTIPLPQRGAPSINQEVCNVIRTLALSLTDSDIAIELNKLNHTTAQGKSFTSTRVAGIRQRFNITKS